MTHTGVLGPVLSLAHPFGWVKHPVAIWIINHVVEIGDALFLNEVAQDIDVAVGLGIGRKNVVVGNDRDFVAVPHLRTFAELAFEHADRAGTTNVVRHEQVGVDPDIIPGPHLCLCGSAREYLLSQRHSQKT